MTAQFQNIRNSLNNMFSAMESLSLVNSYNSEHTAAQYYAQWFEQNLNSFIDTDNGYGNYKIIPYNAAYILNYIRTYINKYEEEARLALTEAPMIQALIIKHGFAKVVKEEMYTNDAVTHLVNGYREFHGDVSEIALNAGISENIPMEQNNQAISAVLGTDMPLQKEKAVAWMAHYIMLSPSCDMANKAIDEYNNIFNAKMPHMSPKRILDYKKKEISEICMAILDYSETETHSYITQEQAKILDIEIPATTHLDTTTKYTKEELEARQSYENTAESSSIESIAAEYGISIISGEDWKKSEYSRKVPILIKNFDFRHIKITELGRANYMLIAPKFKNDIRIEIKAQSVAGTAGDKLPVSIRRYRKWSEKNVYGKTVVAVLGNKTLFSDEALEMAREESLAAEKSNPGKLLYAEGFDAFKNILTSCISDVTQKFEVASPAASDSPGLS